MTQPTMSGTVSQAVLAVALGPVRRGGSLPGEESSGLSPTPSTRQRIVGQLHAATGVSGCEWASSQRPIPCRRAPYYPVTAAQRPCRPVVGPRSSLADNAPSPPSIGPSLRTSRRYHSEVSTRSLVAAHPWPF